MLPFTIALGLNTLTNDVPGSVDVVVVVVLVVEKHIPIADLMVRPLVVVVGTSLCSIADLGTDDTFGIAIHIVCSDIIGKH